MKKFLSLIISILFLCSSTLPVLADDVLKGGVTENDFIKKFEQEIFTGEIESLDRKDIIHMTVSKVLDSSITIEGDEPEAFQAALNQKKNAPFYILKTEKGAGGPNKYHDAHQIPLKNPMTDSNELRTLEDWLTSYNFKELFDAEKGFTL